MQTNDNEQRGQPGELRDYTVTDADRIGHPPMAGTQEGGVQGTESEIRVPIREEELVITKRWVVKEVLVIRKRVVEEMRHVEADLRKERLDVERVDSDGRGEPGRAGRNPNDGR